MSTASPPADAPPPAGAPPRISGSTAHRVRSVLAIPAFRRLWLVTAVLLLVAGLVVGGLVGSLLLLAWLGVLCAGVTAAIPYGRGLTEHRQ